ncbi:MAG TPA: hypothetical protein VJ788_07555 [Gemmatimonadota bacterium]|nr:hypothetical protein [Gemmatimonadota bacterium]
MKDSRSDELAASLFVLGAIVVLAIVGLVTDGNWPKIARVATAFLSYVVVLLAGRGAAGERVPFRAFALAGGACGLVSGLVRAEVRGAVVAAGVLAGAFLLGGMHWLALRGWRRLHSMTMR